MKLPPRETTAESDLTIPFQQSALKSTADQDPFFQHLKIRFIKPAEDAAALQVQMLALHPMNACPSPHTGVSAQTLQLVSNSRIL